MQPRGQLWFQLEQVCRDFKDFSGLPQREALAVLVAVLSNMLDQQREELERLDAPAEGGPGEAAAGDVTGEV
jgi:hypothetical protein